MAVDEHWGSSEPKTIRGITYIPGKTTFKCYKAASGKGGSEGGGGTAITLTKDKTYLFRGWAEAGDSSTTVTHPYNIGTEGGSAIGWYKAEIFPYKTYTIRFNGNGYSDKSDSGTKLHGVDYALRSFFGNVNSYQIAYNLNGGTSTTPSTQRSTLTQIKWNPKSDGSGTDRNAGYEQQNDASVTWYAKWK
jgi:hypothetical protein